MRILTAVSNRFLMGGAEHHLRTLIPALRARGHHVALLYENPGPPHAPTIDEAGAGLPSWCASSKALDELLHELRSWRVDIVYVHGLSDPDLEAALLKHFPAVLCAHNYYGTCV